MGRRNNKRKGGDKNRGGGGGGNKNRGGGGGGGNENRGGGGGGGGQRQANPQVVNNLFAAANQRKAAKASGGGKNKAAGQAPAKAANTNGFAINGAQPAARATGSGKGNARGSLQQIFGSDGASRGEFNQARKAHGNAAAKNYIKQNFTPDQVKSGLRRQFEKKGQMQGFFGQAAGATSSADAGNVTSNAGEGNLPAFDPADYGNTTEEPQTHDYSADMEAMLAPLRAQLEELTNATKEKTISGSSDSGLSSKSSYSYQPSSSQVGGSVDSSTKLFDNWMNSQESLNRASTAYLFAPGGTRREVEGEGSSSTDTGNNDGDEGMKYWNQTDSDLIQADLADTQYDPEEAKKRASYFSNGNRAAGSVFDAWS